MYNVNKKLLDNTKQTTLRSQIMLSNGYRSLWVAEKPQTNDLTAVFNQTFWVYILRENTVFFMQKIINNLRFASCANRFLPGENIAHPLIYKTSPW